MMEHDFINDYISNVLNYYNVSFAAHHENKLSNLENLMFDLENIRNTLEVEKLLNKVRLERFIIKYPQFVELIKVNAKYKGIHSGKRCFVLGNGPSLNMQDLTLLKDEYVFTVSNICRHEKFDDFKSTYHLYADHLFFNLSDKSEAVKQLQEDFKYHIKNYYSRNNTICFLSTLGYDFVMKYDLNMYANIEFFSTPLFFYDGYDEEIDYSKPSPYFETVVQWSIAMAIYMGFNEIYLLGCDNDNIIGYIDGKRAMHSYKENDTDKLVYSHIHTLRTTESMFVGFGRLFHYYAELLKYCEKRNVKLINCSAKTILDCIPILPYEEVINKKV